MRTVTWPAEFPATGVLHWFKLPRRWTQRHYQRCDLNELDDHLLRDIGLTRRDVERECAKPFWSR